jgi:guanylate kinase
VTAPGGAGKGTMLKVLLERYPKLEMIPSYVTRPRRPNEKAFPEGNYIFVSLEHLYSKMAKGEMVEVNDIDGHKYGKSFESILGLQGDVVGITEVDVNGLEAIVNKRDQFKGLTILPFMILPPNQSVLKQRLVNRGSETCETISRRVGLATSEICFYGGSYQIFAGVVVNENNGLEFAIESFVRQLATFGIELK